MIRLIIFTLVILSLLTACASGKADTAVTPTAIPATATPQPPTATPEPPSPFAYDDTIPFDVIVNSEEERDGVTIVDFSFAGHDPEFSSSTNGRTLAYLVKPAGDGPFGEGPFPSVIYLHWLGPSKGSRDEFLDDAVALAQEHGVVSLLPQGYLPWMHAFYGDEGDHDLVIEQVKALRRGIDFLVSQPEVDPERLAFIGHDYGALYGGILAGVEPRLKTAILIAGVPTFADWAGYFSVTNKDEYARLMAEVNPEEYVSQASPASLLFQFGERDAFVTPERANAFFEAASEPKAIEWYDDLHQMTNEESRQARADWLIKELALTR